MAVLNMKGESMPEQSTRDTVMRKLRSSVVVKTEYGRLPGEIVGRYFKDKAFYMCKTSKGVLHDVTENKFV